MPSCFFVSDIHGRPGRYRALAEAVLQARPDALFLGGDLLPHPLDFSWRRHPGQGDFATDFLVPLFADLRRTLGTAYPEVFLILGNDDSRANEETLLEAEERGLWRYAHGRVLAWGDLDVVGYSCIPPSPFQLKDWERYDVSRFVDPGSVPPEEGRRSDGMAVREILHTTIATELEELSSQVRDFGRTILLSHCPPYDTPLDRAALDGKMVDHAPLDVHIGSIAIRRYLEEHQPLLGLHGHVHESRRLTGVWKSALGGTTILGAAHDGPELALVRFSTDAPEAAALELIPCPAPAPGAMDERGPSPNRS